MVEQLTCNKNQRSHRRKEWKRRGHHHLFGCFIYDCFDYNISNDFAINHCTASHNSTSCYNSCCHSSSTIHCDYRSAKVVFSATREIHFPNLHFHKCKNHNPFNGQGCHQSCCIIQQNLQSFWCISKNSQDRNVLFVIDGHTQKGESQDLQNKSNCSQIIVTLIGRMER